MINNDEKLIYEYVKSILILFLMNALFFIGSAVWIYFYMDNLITLDIKSINSIFNYILENKVIFFILILYLYSVYQFITKKTFTFLILLEFKVPFDKRFIYEKIPVFINELLNNIIIQFLFLLPLFYYLYKEFNFIKALLYLFVLFFVIKIIEDIVKKVLDLHNKVFYNYKLITMLYGFFDNEDKTNLRSDIINVLDNNMKNKIMNTINYILKVLNIFKFKYVIISSIFVFINVLIMLFIIKYFVIIMILLVIFLISPITLIYYKIEKIRIDQLKFIYEDIISRLRIIGVSPIIMMFLLLLYIFDMHFPLIIKTILSVVVWWVGQNIILVNNKVSLVPKPVKYLRTVDGKEYLEVLSLEDYRDLMLLLDRENKAIKLFKNKIVEIK